MVATILGRSPSEIHLFGVYLPPFLVICLVGLVCAILLAQVLNPTGWSRLFWHPPLAFVALWMLASSLFGLIVLAP